MSKKSYYEILGVSKNATADELKRAYRKLAMQYHPDRHVSDSEADKKAAEEKFKEINHAYEVLSDDQKRAAYDTYGDENGPQMGQGGGFGGFSGFGGNSSGFGFNVDDIFSSIFNGFGGGQRQSSGPAPQRGRDILVRLVLTFEEAAFGVKKVVTIRRTEECPKCHGTGAKNESSYKKCTRCNGTGRVTQVQNTILGQMSTTVTCPDCQGTGKIITEKCDTCGGRGYMERGREITVDIPAGIDSGQRITYSGEGNAGRNGGERGSVVVEIQVKEHSLFKRVESDLYLDLPITFVEASLGCELEIPTLKNPYKLKIPEGTQSGTIFTIKGMGIKKLRSMGYGNMYVKVIVEIPKGINKEQKELLNKLNGSFDKKQFAKKKDYTDKIGKLY